MPIKPTISFENLEVAFASKSNAELRKMYLIFATLNKNWRFFADLQNFTNTKYYEVYGFKTMPLNASIGAVFNW
ncbi:MAG: hypothetical protein EB038_09895 [Cyclobacteriaceae bacterium]|nr:hypothetical protein [Cyclobacteriaceae bacterium]